jgi:hypothetical protein
MLVIEDRGSKRPIFGQQRRCRAMGRHSDCRNAIFGVQLRKALQQESPMSPDIKMRIWRAGQNLIRAGRHCNFRQIRQADQRQFGIRLSNIDDRNMLVAHGI